MQIKVSCRNPFIRRSKSYVFRGLRYTPPDNLYDLDRRAFEQLLEEYSTETQDDPFTVSGLCHQFRPLWREGLRPPTEEEVMTIGDHHHRVLPRLPSNPARLHISWSHPNRDRHPARLPSILPSPSNSEDSVETLAILGHWANVFVSAADHVPLAKQTEAYSSTAYLMRVLNSVDWNDSTRSIVQNTLRQLHNHVRQRSMTLEEPRDPTSRFDRVFAITLAESRLFTYTTATVLLCPRCEKIWASAEGDGNSVRRRDKVSFPGPKPTPPATIPGALTSCFARYGPEPTHLYACPNDCSSVLDWVIAVADRLPPFLVLGSDWSDYWRDHLRRSSSGSIQASFSLSYYDITKPDRALNVGYRLAALVLHDRRDRFLIGLSDESRRRIHWRDLCHPTEQQWGPVDGLADTTFPRHDNADIKDLELDALVLEQT